MKLISHKGNLRGPDPTNENHPDQILKVLKQNYDVEIDVWYVGKKFYLGHDSPLYQIKYDFLINKALWIHTKNIQALEKLHEQTNCFFHDKDNAVLTSFNYIWVYPGKPLVKNCVALLFNNEYRIRDLKKCYAICTDNIFYWKNRVLIF